VGTSSVSTCDNRHHTAKTHLASSIKWLLRNKIKTQQIHLYLCGELIDVHFPFKVSVKRKRPDQMDEIVILRDGFVITRSKKSCRTKEDFPAVRAGH
jgi:hypothetical protein